MWHIAERFDEDLTPPPERVQLLHMDDDDWLACIDFDMIAPTLECNDPRWARTCKNSGTEREPWAIDSDLAQCARRAHTFRTVPPVPVYVHDPEPSPLELAVDWMARRHAPPPPPEVDEDERKHMRAHAQKLLREQFNSAVRTLRAAGLTDRQIHELARDMGLDETE